MSLTNMISVRLDYDLKKALDLVSPEARSAFAKEISLANGVGADQADKFWADSRQIAASGTDSLDFAAAGTLKDPLGDDFMPVRIKGILVYARATNVNNVHVTRPAANGVPIFLAAGDGLPVRPGGLFVLWARDAIGYVVTATTADLIDILNSAGGTVVDYDILIVGASG